VARIPSTHHLDRRAADIDLGPAYVVLDAPTDTVEIEKLYTVNQIAGYLGVTRQWLSDGRIHGYGPPYIKVSHCHIRYRHTDIVRWLDGRVHQSTAEYDTLGVGRPRKVRA
jgi:hypothetical protein